jgi:stalled ribosome rescue protein Dom34
MKAIDDVTKAPELGQPLPGARHAVVWLDHVTAVVISYTDRESHEQTVRSAVADRRAHSDAGQSGSGHARDDVDFFDEVVRLIGKVPEVLIVGPGLAKTSFERYVRTNHPLLARRIAGVETVDHPTAGQIVKFAKQYFRGVDQLLGDTRV